MNESDLRSDVNYLGSSAFITSRVYLEPPSGSSIETSMTTLTNQDRGCSNLEPRVIMAPCQRYDRQIVTSWENGLIQFF